ncbi:hypothetical protein [Gaetbulibacter aestuarii]|uniref:Uncharacterized protein n=1 Tax=Gaetbulibacter aestuarii TaxID=1502358 RepID=A0ABW7N115_9FLAO
MIYKVPYTKYSFNGGLIDEKTYLDLKSSFEKNSYLSFPEPKTYYEEHKGESLAVIISAILLVVFVPFTDSLDGTPFFIIIPLSFIALLFSTIFQFSQFLSFQKARKEQKRYLIKLRKDIIQSTGYSDFVKLQKNNR